MAQKNVIMKRYGTSDGAVGVPSSNADIVYPETYERLVKGKSYFSGILGEERVFSETSIYVVPMKKVIAMNGMAMSHRPSDGRIVINENGIYVISGRIHMSDAAQGRMRIGINKNSNVELAKSLSYGMQMPRNMDGVTNTDGAEPYNGAYQSFLSVYWVGKLNKGDTVYLTYQKVNGGLIRMNRKSGMEAFLLQAEL